MPLTVVPTPVGNLEDMTLRGLRILREADVIACEDTRHTLQLLNHYDIKKPLISCHEHNETERCEEIAALVRGGKNAALVSDAGTPGLSDPGGKVVKYMLENGLPVDVLPGANALLPALLLSGIGMESFTFAGFLKGRESEKKNRLAELAKIKNTLVFYVAPHRLLRELELIASVLGDRKASLVREISKIHQETIASTLLGFKDLLTEERMRGEFVCVVEGFSEESSDETEWLEEAKKLYRGGETVKNVVNLIAAKYGTAPNRIKKTLLEA